MKKQEVKEKFQQLRAEGISYEKISKMIKVSKPALIEWGKEFKKEIEKLKAIRYEVILEKYKVTRENRIERIARELEIAWKNYETIDYKDLSKREILMMIIRLEKRLREETEQVLNPKTPEDEDGPEEHKIHYVKTTFDKDPVTEELVYEMDPKSEKDITLPKLNRR
jgi:intein-encoded DNA endonuclease-like protein